MTGSSLFFRPSTLDLSLYNISLDDLYSIRPRQIAGIAGEPLIAFG